MFIPPDTCVITTGQQFLLTANGKGLPTVLSAGADSIANEEEGLIGAATLPTKASLAQLQESDAVEELHSGNFAATGFVGSPDSDRHWVDEASRWAYITIYLPVLAISWSVVMTTW